VLLTAASLLTGLAVGVPGAAPADAAPLTQTTMITSNLLGSTIRGGGGPVENKWSTMVRGFVRGANVVMLQEVGSAGPPGSDALPDIQSNGETIQHFEWTVGTSRDAIPFAQVYYLQTDDNGGTGTGGRVNIAIATMTAPDEVVAVQNPTPGRNALGVRFGMNWYFSIHGLSGSGGDDVPVVNSIVAAVNSWNPAYTVTIGGDFNLDPNALRNRQGFPAAMRILRPAQATHVGGGELDYFVTNDPSQNLPGIHVLPTSQSDHNPVMLGELRGAAEPQDLTVMTTGDGTIGSAPNETLNGMREWLHLAAVGSYGDIELVGSDTSSDGTRYEGAPGEKIVDIASRDASAVPKYRPNMVLLQAGTWDLADGDQDGAFDRLSALIDQIQIADASTVVAVATLGPATDAADEARVTAYNTQIRQLVADRVAAGQRVVLADMSTLTTGDLGADGVTPNASGQQKIADAYVDAMIWALFMDWVSAPSGGDTTPFGQQIAMAAYSNPTSDRSDWDRLINADSSKASVLVANVLNGPGSEVDDGWVNVIGRAHASGKHILGYVDTGYFGAADGRLTRLGSSAAKDWLTQAEQDVDAWYHLYGSSIDGIFFDDGYNQCGNSNAYPQLYAELNYYAKRYHPGAMTVLNPGTVVPQCYENSADVLLTFEGSYDTYESSAYQALGWTPSSPSKIWHIVYGVPADKISLVDETSQTRGAGYVEITDDVLSNPYDQQPGAAYWSAVQAAVPGGTPRIAPVPPYNPTAVPAPAQPYSPYLSSWDYSSATIGWGEVPNAVRYVVYENGQAAATVLPGENPVTMGGLTPGGAVYNFSIAAVNSAGVESLRSSPLVKMFTRSLPGDQSISNIHATVGATTTTYSADYLLPYSFHRVYISPPINSGETCWWMADNDPAIGGPFCAHWLIENTTLLVYSGTSVGDWSWTPVAYVPPTVTGRYTYTWTVNNSNIGDATDFVSFEGQGYSPFTDVYTAGCSPDSWGGC
jgi:lysophospholipase L1-like esterase